MKKLVVSAVVMMAFVTNAMGQGQASSVTVGFAPIGRPHVSITLKDEKYKYDYKQFWNANIGYEKQFKGVVTLSEVTFAKAAFDEYDLTGESEWFNPAQTADLYAVSFMQYAGKTFNKNRRLQVPIYLGVGGEYINGGPIHNLTVDFGFKARVKFYVTRNIGIYVGGTWRLGYGVKSASESSSSGGDVYSVVSTISAADAGIIFGL